MMQTILSDNNVLNVRPFRPEDEDAVVALWRDCGLVVPWNDPHQDIAIKMTVQPELFLVGELDGKVAASAMAGFDGHRGWIYYLGVTPEMQGRGYGRDIVEAVEDKLKELGCIKINLQVRTTNTKVIDFYMRLGYKDDHVLGLGKKI